MENHSISIQSSETANLATDSASMTESTTHQPKNALTNQVEENASKSHQSNAAEMNSGLSLQSHVSSVQDNRDAMTVSSSLQEHNNSSQDSMVQNTQEHNKSSQDSMVQNTQEHNKSSQDSMVHSTDAASQAQHQPTNATVSTSDEMMNQRDSDQDSVSYHDTSVNVTESSVVENENEDEDIDMHQNSSTVSESNVSPVPKETNLYQKYEVDGESSNSFDHITYDSDSESNVLDKPVPIEQDIFTWSGSVVTKNDVDPLRDWMACSNFFSDTTPMMLPVVGSAWESQINFEGASVAQIRQARALDEANKKAATLRSARTSNKTTTDTSATMTTNTSVSQTQSADVDSTIAAAMQKALAKAQSTTAASTSSTKTSTQGGVDEFSQFGALEDMGKSNNNKAGPSVGSHQTSISTPNGTLTGLNTTATSSNTLTAASVSATTTSIFNSNQKKHATTNNVSSQSSSRTNSGLMGVDRDKKRREAATEYLASRVLSKSLAKASLGEASLAAGKLSMPIFWGGADDPLIHDPTVLDMLRSVQIDIAGRHSRFTDGQHTFIGASEILPLLVTHAAAVGRGKFIESAQQFAGISKTTVAKLWQSLLAKRGDASNLNTFATLSTFTQHTTETQKKLVELQDEAFALASRVLHSSLRGLQRFTLPTSALTSLTGANVSGTGNTQNDAQGVASGSIFTGVDQSRLLISHTIPAQALESQFYPPDVRDSDHARDIYRTPNLRVFSKLQMNDKLSVQIRRIHRKPSRRVNNRNGAGTNDESDSDGDDMEVAIDTPHVIATGHVDTSEQKGFLKLLKLYGSHFNLPSTTEVLGEVDKKENALIRRMQTHQHTAQLTNNTTNSMTKSTDIFVADDSDEDENVEETVSLPNHLLNVDKEEGLSATEGDLIMVEYTEESPLVLSMFGMASRILTYWRPRQDTLDALAVRKQQGLPDIQNDELIQHEDRDMRYERQFGISEDDPPLLDVEPTRGYLPIATRGPGIDLPRTHRPPAIFEGQLCMLPPGEPYPLLGDVRDDEASIVLMNRLYHVPLFRHEAKATDFLLILRRNPRRTPKSISQESNKTLNRQDRYTGILRPIPNGCIWLAGQIEPKMPVFVPLKEAVMDFTRDYYGLHLLRLFERFGRVSHSNRTIMLSARDVASRFRGPLELVLATLVGTTIARYMEEYKRYVKLNDAPTIEALLDSDKLTPENVCLFMAMRHGEWRLRQSGVERTNTLDAIENGMRSVRALQERLDIREGIELDEESDPLVQGLEQAQQHRKNRRIQRREDMLAAATKVASNETQNELAKSITKTGEHDLFQKNELHRDFLRFVHAARRILYLLHTTPWQLSADYVDVTIGGRGGVLSLSGPNNSRVGDPSGRGEGYSFIKESVTTKKTTNTVTQQQQPQKREGTARDLRKLTMEALDKELAAVGVSREEIASLERWDRVGKLREMHSALEADAAHRTDGGMDANGKYIYAAASRTSLGERHERKHKQACTIQIQQRDALRSTSPARLSDDSDSDLDSDSSDDEDDMMESIERELTTRGLDGVAAAGAAARARGVARQQEEAAQYDSFVRELKGTSQPISQTNGDILTTTSSNATDKTGTTTEEAIQSSFQINRSQLHPTLRRLPEWLLHPPLSIHCMEAGAMTYAKATRATGNYITRRSPLVDVIHLRDQALADYLLKNDHPDQQVLRIVTRSLDEKGNEITRMTFSRDYFDTRTVWLKEKLHVDLVNIGLRQSTAKKSVAEKAVIDYDSQQEHQVLRNLFTSVFKHPQTGQNTYLCEYLGFRLTPAVVNQIRRRQPITAPHNYVHVLGETVPICTLCRFWGHRKENRSCPSADARTSASVQLAMHGSVRTSGRHRRIRTRGGKRTREYDSDEFDEELDYGETDEEEAQYSGESDEGNGPLELNEDGYYGTRKLSKRQQDAVNSRVAKRNMLHQGYDDKFGVATKRSRLDSTVNTFTNNHSTVGTVAKDSTVQFDSNKPAIRDLTRRIERRLLDILHSLKPHVAEALQHASERDEITIRYDSVNSNPISFHSIRRDIVVRKVYDAESVLTRLKLLYENERNYRMALTKANTPKPILHVYEERCNGAKNLVGMFQQWYEMHKLTLDGLKDMAKNSPLKPPVEVETSISGMVDTKSHVSTTTMTNAETSETKATNQGAPATMQQLFGEDSSSSEEEEEEIIGGGVA